MSENGVDLLGIKPIAESINTATKITFEGVSSFLSKICGPAAGEFGFFLQDKVRNWRAGNASNIIAGAALVVNNRPNSERLRAHPRLVNEILEHGSWYEDQEVINMWSGLLATSCTESGQNQGNLYFINLLSQLTSNEVKVLNFICNAAVKSKTPQGVLIADNYETTIDRVKGVYGSDDIHAIDLALDHLREIGLLETGSGLHTFDKPEIYLTPSPVALNLYIRCQGFDGPPPVFFGL